jgi:predicted DNA-binding transcriptional regulator AlpA
MSTTVAPESSLSISGIITLRRLTEISTLSPPTIWRMRRRGEIPEPIQLSPGRKGWRRDVIEKWLAERGAAR